MITPNKIVINRILIYIIRDLTKTLKKNFTFTFNKSCSKKYSIKKKKEEIKRIKKSESGEIVSDRTHLEKEQNDTNAY